MAISTILNKISKTKKFNNYTEFKLKKPLDINDNEIRNIIKKIMNLPNTIVYYNNITNYCDLLCVIDINGVRYYEFEDNMWTMENKGIII